MHAYTLENSHSTLEVFCCTPQQASGKVHP